MPTAAIRPDHQLVNSNVHFFICVFILILTQLMPFAVVQNGMMCWTEITGKYLLLYLTSLGVCIEIEAR
jgi:hypothetical protein